MTGLTPIVRVVSAALALAAGAGLTAGPQSLAPLPDVLAKAGSYLADYQDRVTMVMLEEDYTQRRTYTWATSNVGANAVSTESKRLRSDVVMSVEPGPRWVTFRDVFEVDGRAVRDRDERLAKLFLAPTDQTVDQAGRILAEGARFNIYPQLNRTLNVPFTTLVFLLTAHQPRSTFTIDGTETVGGQPTVVLRFVEHGTPRILKSDDGAAARGTFWIEPTSGRVLRSELVFTSSGKGIGSVTATIRVTYAQESRTGLWLPTVMDERYAFANLATSIITGTARYSNARQFAVDTNSNVKPLAK